MAKTIISTDKAPRSAAYSQGVKAGGLIFVAGQGPFDPQTGEVIGSTIQEQTAQCLRNVEAILQAAGRAIDKVVRTAVIFADPDDFAGLNEEWVKWFPGDPPARHGAKLPVQLKGMKISVAAIAEV